MKFTLSTFAVLATAFTSSALAAPTQQAGSAAAVYPYDSAWPYLNDGRRIFWSGDDGRHIYDNSPDGRRIYGNEPYGAYPYGGWGFHPRA
jgi:hypothetical protein